MVAFKAAQVDAFIARVPGFRIVPWRPLWEDSLHSAPPPSADGSTETLLMTPASFCTDGFYVAVLERL